MKKLYKKGFSLAEILIALGIISIISTMGMTIARKSIDRAYNLYIYSSYKGISEAINIANADITNTNNALDYSNPFGLKNSLIDSLTNYANSILGTLSASDDVVATGDQISFNVPNGVSYRIIKSDCTSRCDATLGPTTSFEQDHSANYVIAVTIPQRKTRDTSTATYCLLYQTNSPHELLIPINSGVDDDGTRVCATSDSLSNLASRIDLLPFFVDTGIEGRVLRTGQNGATEYNRRRFRSFERAYCEVFGQNIEYNGTEIIECPIQLTDEERGLGSVLLISPQHL